MNLYVSNLGFLITSVDLRKLFDAYGKVSSVKIVTDQYTGRSRGFGFVEMESDQDGQEAMKSLNLKDVGGRQISVVIARPKTDTDTRK
jgi:cold-inducible RNA-binding protein